jgi:hypothetical protein
MSKKYCNECGDVLDPEVGWYSTGTYGDFCSEEDMEAFMIGLKSSGVAVRLSLRKGEEPDIVY